MNKIIARALSRTCGHAPTHAQVYAYTRPCTRQRAFAHARLYAHALPHAYHRTRQRAFAHAYTYTCICMNLHVRTHVLDFSSLDTWMGYMTKKHLSLARVFC